MSERAAEMLVMRADASPQMGTGHVMRCLALAQAWQDQGGSALFLLAGNASPLEARLRREGLDVRHLNVSPGSNDDARQTAGTAKKFDARWVVVDGYHFDNGYDATLREAGLRVLAVDDYGHKSFANCNAVLNQNPYAVPGRYSEYGTDTDLLLGLRYVLLRREFNAWRGWRRQVAALANKLLITMGGADPANASGTVLQALEHFPDVALETKIVVGASNPHRESLVTLATRVPGVTLLDDVADMPALIAWADVGIGAGGVTALERVFLQLPSLAVVLADNQREVAASLHEQGLVESLGEASALPPPALAEGLRALLLHHSRREQMAQRAASVIDGRGAERVVRYLRRPPLSFRQVAAQDCELIWRWANDPQTRAASFSSEPIPLDVHVAWFQRRLSEASSLWYMAMVGQQPAGHVRFEREANETAEIHLNVAPEWRGDGFGGQIIERSLNRLLREASVRSVRARIKRDNVASLRAFANAGFRPVEDRESPGECATLEYHR